MARVFNGICSAIKGNVFESVLLRWINLDPVTQSEVRKKEKNIPYVNACLLNLEKWY